MKDLSMELVKRIASTAALMVLFFLTGYSQAQHNGPAAPVIDDVQLLNNDEVIFDGRPILRHTTDNPAAILYDNGGLSTGTLTKSGVTSPSGTTWSEVQNPSGDTTQSNTSAGASGGITTTTRFRLADNFTIPAGQSWAIDSIATFAYQTGNSGVTTPFISANFLIWSGIPGDPGSNPVFGDTTLNELGTSSFSTIYRVFNTRYPTGTAPGTTRPVWRNVLYAGTTLGPGTYWLDWQTQITGSGAHFAPSVTVVGRRGLPEWNARQRTAAGWLTYLDTGNPAAAPDSAQDFPFIIYGTTGPTSVGTGKSTLPNELALVRNYPNPFNPSTNITYQVPEAGRIMLTVTDVLGRQVAVLVNGPKDAGVHTISWNAENAGSGVYFAVLQNGVTQRTMKMMLTR